MAENYAVFFLSSLFFLVGVLEAASISSSALQSVEGEGQVSEQITCKLPPYPQHGKWKIVNGSAKPGDKVLESTVIVFECDAGYKLSSKIKYLFCDEDWDSMEIPECEELCPPLYSSTTYDLKCRNKRGKEIKCNEATSGTLLEYNCAQFYEVPFGYSKTFLCQDKKWQQKPVCVPVCGLKITEAKTLIYGSKPNSELEYPWVVAVYSKSEGFYKNICGGSILSATVVLTAAHCVTNSYGDVHPPENFAIGAGKLYNKYKAPEDTRAQYLEVSKIFVPEDYKADNRRFIADIAVLVIAKEINFNEVIQPVCFNNLESLHLHPESIGEVSGWGRAEGDVASDVLRTLKIPYKHETTCAHELPKYWADMYYFRDKICAGFVNESTSVCDGDSGNGLAFKSLDYNRYFIHGVVSLGHKDGNYCNIQQNSLYTRVASYYQFIDQLLFKYKPKIKDCKLPDYPKNGVWTAEEQDLKPGDIVPSSTVLTVKCNVGYQPSSITTSVECGSASNIPTCEKLCPESNFPKGTFSQCINKEEQAIPCSEAADGSTLSFGCPTFYKTPYGTTNEKTTCVKGKWEPWQPECMKTTRDCGKAPASKNSNEKRFKYPWTAGLYKFDNSTEEEYKYICGASIISTRAVLTAAQCVTDKSGDLLPKDDYLVGAGKVYAKYKDSRDVEAQYKQVSHIVTNPYYERSYDHPGDIAVLFVKTGFKLNNYVQPVCLPNVIDRKLQVGDKGVVSGLKLKEGSDEFEEPEALEVIFSKKDICDSPKYPQYSTGNLDKICAGFNNDSFCTGPEDYGKAFYLQNPEDGRYYVHGVITVAFNSPIDPCQKKIFFTNTVSYYYFLDCVLSNFLQTTFNRISVARLG